MDADEGLVFAGASLGISMLVVWVIFIIILLWNGGQDEATVIRKNTESFGKMKWLTGMMKARPEKVKTQENLLTILLI
jgi:hypothetical protein